MIEKRLDERTVLLKIEPGEEIITKIKAFCQEHELKSGTIMGIGAVKRAVLGYYTGEEYAKREIDENMELISCLGNIATAEDGYIIHLHAVLGDREGEAKAGHLFEGVVSFTGEFFITSFSKRIPRAYDPVTGLTLIE
jgi:hypothetical protein